VTKSPVRHKLYRVLLTMKQNERGPGLWIVESEVEGRFLPRE